LYFFCISTTKRLVSRQLKAIFAKNTSAKLMYALKINFEEKGMAPVVLENVKAGESLLEVLLDAGIELHHNCGAVCACSTCHLYVKKGMEFLEETIRSGFEGRLVLMTTSPYGLPLRIDLPTVNPTEWEEDEEDGD
jgi:Na+-transporting NADH:ubiquinone oxidoreductase subunit NqrF